MEKTQSTSFVCKTWKTKTVAAVLAIIAAVAIPQALHYLGMVTNLGTSLGETFLPMHIAIFLVGFFAGAWAGFSAGLISPVVSFLLTLALGRAMPTAQMLPFMMIELAVYGLTTGLLARTKMPALASLVIAQIAGRAVRALALVFGIYLFSSPMNVAIIWNSILTGLPGLILQWIIIPLLVFYVEKKAKHE